MTVFRTAFLLGGVLLAASLITQAPAQATTTADALTGKASRAYVKSLPVSRIGIRLADVSESFKLLPNVGEGAAEDNMGYSVAVSGDTAVVGAYLNDEAAANDAGSVYVFIRGGGNSWTRQQRLVASTPTVNANYGYSVTVSGDTMAVGAPFEGGSGAVYVYTRSAGVWTLQQRLVSTDILPGDNFGFSVALDANTLVAGANLDSIPTLNAGSAYVFTRSAGTWTQQQRLIASDAATGDQFGNAVSISGERIVVGAPKDSNAFGIQAGGAYAYTRNTGVWTQTAKLTPPTGTTEDEFGASVSISGTSALIGQPFFNGVPGSNSGRASVFLETTGTWNFQAHLLASDTAVDDFFGHSVAISGDLAVVGAYVDDLADVVNAGSAYVYRRTGTSWAQLDKYIASDAALNDNFGFGVALAGGTAIVGAPMDDVTGVGNNSGSAYVFNNGTATTTTLNVSSNNIVFGQNLTLTAQVSGGTPTGTVNFLNGVATLGSAAVNGSGQAQLVLNTPNAGNYSITANYAGDSEHLPSASAATAVTVARATTTMVLNSSSISAAYGQSVTFTATMSVTPPGGGTPTGNVVFSDNGSPIGTVALVAGSAQLTLNNLNAGTHPITASYAQTANYFGSAAGPISQEITQAVVVMTLTTSPNPSLQGNSTALVATLTGGIPVGTVAFQMVSPTSGPVGNASISNGVATINTAPLAIGTYVFQAFYTGDANHAFATDTSPDHEVIPAADLSISKSNGEDMVQSGSTTVYTIVVSNAGPAATIGALVSDDIDDTLFDEAATSWSCVDDGNSSCAVGSGMGDISVLVDLPAASSVTFTVNAPVRVTSESGISNTATVSTGAGVGDPDMVNNSATDADNSGMFGDEFED